MHALERVQHSASWGRPRQAAPRYISYSVGVSRGKVDLSSSLRDSLILSAITSETIQENASADADVERINESKAGVACARRRRRARRGDERVACRTHGGAKPTPLTAHHVEDAVEQHSGSLTRRTYV